MVEDIAKACASLFFQYPEAVGNRLRSASLPSPPVPAYAKFPAPAGFCQAFPGYSWFTSVT